MLQTKAEEPTDRMPYCLLLELEHNFTIVLCHLLCLSGHCVKKIDRIEAFVED